MEKEFKRAQAIVPLHKTTTTIQGAKGNEDYVCVYRLPSDVFALTLGRVSAGWAGEGARR